WSFPARSWRSTTCSTGSRGSSRASRCGRSGCCTTSRRATGSSPASACCSRSSSRGSGAMPPTGSSRKMPSARRRRNAISASSSGATTRSRAGSTSTRCSTSPGTPATLTPSSSGSPLSNGGRSPSMPEAATHVGSGKVRELFELDEGRLLLVASDRISTFDVVLPTEIPDKGRVLTGLSGFWFARTRELVPNHLLGLRDDGRSTECRRLEMLPLECVVRGYLAGSGWKDYRASGAVCGHALPAGLRESERLPEPIFTPSTKATEGHDENIDREQAAALVGGDRFDDVERVSPQLYRAASDRAAD